MPTKSIGKMREVVVFRVNTPPDAGAGAIDSYSTLLTTRGQFIADSGNRALQFGAISDNTGNTLVVRFQTALLNNLRSDTKIIINNIVYTFSTYKLIDQKKHLYEFKIQCQTQ